jgi:hypothetical protein
MDTAPRDASDNSTLARIQTGESMRISRILFGALRSVCDDLGLRENERFRCRIATPTMLVLEADDGHIVSLARDWARFIRVEPADALTPS